MEDTYRSRDEFGVSAKADPRSASFTVRAGLPAKQINVGNLERFLCIVAGFSGLFLLSRRLLVYLSLAFFSAYLLYRGLTGYCLIYERANINTNARGRTQTPAPDLTGSRHDTAASSTPPVDYNDDPINGRVEEASWESFPASDPPGF